MLVRGHAGHEANERADRLAQDAARDAEPRRTAPLPADVPPPRPAPLVADQEQLGLDL